MSSVVYEQVATPSRRHSAVVHLVIKALRSCVKAHQALADAYMKSATIASGVNALPRLDDDKR